MQQKERILHKAHELFNSYGIRSVSMDDVATQIGMSKKTVYQYYTDKEELVDAVFHLIIDNRKADCIEAKKKSENAVHEVFLAFDRVQEMFADMNPAVLFDMQKYHPEVFKKFLEFKNGFLYQMIKTNLEWGVKQDLYRPEIDKDILTRYRIHSIMLAFDAEVFPANRTQLLHIEQQLLELFLYGLSTSKGEKLIQKFRNQRKNKLQ